MEITSNNLWCSYQKILLVIGSFFLFFWEKVCFSFVKSSSESSSLILSLNSMRFRSHSSSKNNESPLTKHQCCFFYSELNIHSFAAFDYLCFLLGKKSSNLLYHFFVNALKDLVSKFFVWFFFITVFFFLKSPQNLNLHRASRLISSILLLFLASSFFFGHFQFKNFLKFIRKNCLLF